MVKDFNGKKDDKRYKEIEFYRVTYKGLLSFFGESEGNPTVDRNQSVKG